MPIQSFTIKAVSDAALMQILLTNNLLILGEGAPRNAHGVISSHIGNAALESTGVILSGRYAFIALDEEKFGVASTQELMAALADSLHTGPTLRAILGIAPTDPNSGRPADPLGGLKWDKIKGINEECKRRLIARYGDAYEQITTVEGDYGSDRLAAFRTGRGAMLDAANAAQDAILAATSTAQVEAVTVTWPVI